LHGNIAIFETLNCLGW